MTPLPHDLLARIFLVLVALSPALLVLRSYLIRSYTPTQWMFWAIANYLVRVQWRSDLPLSIPAPDDRGTVIISNHRSSIDPFFIQILHDRAMHWMVAKEYLSHPLFGWFLRNCEVIPVSRGGVDTAATRIAIGYAEKGGIVGMFPEGRINMTDQLLLPGRPGAILIALKAKAALLPCYIEGSPYDRVPWSPLRMRAQAKLRFGQPIDLTQYYDQEPSQELVRQLLLRGMREIAKLAGRDDFEPQVAGRKWKPVEEGERGRGGEGEKGRGGEDETDGS